MKKILSLLSLIFLFNSCAETMALLGPASSGIAGGNIVRSSASSIASYGIKKSTGKSPLEHAVNYSKKNNSSKEKEKCVSFLEATNTEICKAIKVKAEILKKKIDKKSNIKNLKTN